MRHHQINSLSVHLKWTNGSTFRITLEKTTTAKKKKKNKKKVVVVVVVES